ncbi:MAG: N-6 DNA methylase [bacterium]
MQPLDKTLRNRLERTVKDARDVAETAARAALEQLGVGEASPFAHLTDVEREFRRKLRVHGRQLGDVRNADTECQEIDRLTEEVAYEHWHRMLFARFLAENNLLMYDGVAVTLEECDDLAADEKVLDGWVLASRLAARMLPQIFRPDSPVFQLSLPPEHQLELERMMTELPQEVFTASDSLGWVYQFWQAKKKDAVNASEVKIGARELPAVTQLFTEPYMVAFLLDNSLGAWWASHRLSTVDWENAASEEELRGKTALPGVPLEYLRFTTVTTDNETVWEPAAGKFEKWPDNLSELKTLDPCCGSGHFLVAAFLMLVPMRIELEGLTAGEAVDAVLRENIHGLELDQRCVELAAFALALTAWRFPGAGGYRVLPELHIACSGLSVSVAKEEWKQLALDKQNMRIAMDWIYETYKHAPVLGSLLNPTKTNAAKIVRWDELEQMMEQALAQERGDEFHEAGVVAQGLAKATLLLSRQYHLVITNVPYLARGKQSDILRNYCEKHYPEGKSDLATVFLERCLELCTQGGTSSIVLPQNWLFLTRYKKYREKLLNNDTWHLIARLGGGAEAFNNGPGNITNICMISLSRCNKMDNSNDLFIKSLPSGIIRGVDVSKPHTPIEKATALLTTTIQSILQYKQLQNPDSRVTLEDRDEGSVLSEYAISMRGIVSGENDRWERFYWEIPAYHSNWRFLQTTPRQANYCAGKELIIDWSLKGKGMLRPGTTNEAYGKYGVAIGQMSGLPTTLFDGSLYDNNTGVIVPYITTHIAAIWCFCSSFEYNLAVRRIDQKLNVTNATLVKVSFDINYWTKIAEEKYPNGLPKPFSDDPTQWIFHGHPCGSVVWDDEKKWTVVHGSPRTDATVLQVAVARLLGYRWPAETNADMELSDESQAWVQKTEELLSFADEDGIVCIPAVRGEVSAADRLLNMLAAAYGDAWSSDTLSELLNNSDHAGKTLETWLRDKFFLQHCKLFQHRPFIWHIWDGLRDGFAALVNYHKLDRKNLETLIYTYLGDWINRQKQDIAGNVDGTQEKLDAAENLKKRLELILNGEGFPNKENPDNSYGYDIFIRWKPLSQQPIGWDPDLNDGVRLNIRPFITAQVLRLNKKPQLNISWDKDRGKDVATAPWYHLFNGDRINDHHLTLAEKMAEREKGE